MARKTTRKKANPNTMWGGRYALGPAEIMEKINASIGFDRKLYAQDIAGSVAHADMLVAQGILTQKDGRAIRRGLAQVNAEIEQGKFAFSTKLEDIHFNVEARLTELIGPAGGRLHTARSRNDQVALDVRLWVRDAADRLEAMLRDLQAALIERAEEHAGTIMPGFTHLQTAQPITFGHHLLAYVEMFGRDRSRLRDCRAAPERIAARRGGACWHAASHRSAQDGEGAGLRCADGQLARCGVRPRLCPWSSSPPASLCAVHLSRLAEEIVIWCSAPFRFIALSDAFTTGSSIMPQKRNPDAAELSRGKVGRIVGRLRGALHHAEGPAARPTARTCRRTRSRLFDAADSIELCVAGDDRHGARPQGEPRAHARRRLGRLLGGDRSRRLAGALGRPAVPPGPSRDRRAGRRRPPPRASIWTSISSCRDARRSAVALPGMFTRC
jgi:argininosuccinate lyase